MRIPPDVIIEILKITKENYEYKKQLAKEKYDKVVMKLQSEFYIFNSENEIYLDSNFKWQRRLVKCPYGEQILKIGNWMKCVNIFRIVLKNYSNCVINDGFC